MIYDLRSRSNNKSAILYEFKKFDEALEYSNKAIALKPKFEVAYINRGSSLNALKRFTEALESYDRALALAPNLADAYSNKGVTLRGIRRLDEALNNCEYAIELSPDSAEAYNNQATILYELGRFDDAILNYDHAITLKPDFENAYWNKSLLKLLQGNFEEGLMLYEWRWKSGLRDVAGVFNEPLWLGDTSISGKAILIYPEQGLGDIIQMCRYAHKINELGAKVILEVPPSLTSVIKTLQGKIEVIETGVQLPVFDFQCPIMSLPLAFKTTVETIPGNVPYLFSDSAKQKEWHDRLGEKRRPRIGIVCSGSETHSADGKRSIPIKLMRPLLNLPFEFHMLQKEIRPDDAEVLIEFPHVKMHHQNLVDFSDTAALINEMDLVISVDTSVVHLAGALGKSVWVLLSWVPDFRWLLDRMDSPWYPTATLFRQPEINNWDRVIEDVREKLRGMFEIQDSNLMITDSDSLFSRAISLHQAGHVNEAIIIYQQLLVQLPDEPKILSLVGAANLQLGDIVAGVQLLQSSIAMDSNQVLALSNLAYGFHELGRFEEAVVNSRAIMHQGSVVHC